jgi:hypothetical protein
VTNNSNKEISRGRFSGYESPCAPQAFPAKILPSLAIPSPFALHIAIASQVEYDRPMLTMKIIIVMIMTRMKEMAVITRSKGRKLEISQHPGFGQLREIRMFLHFKTTTKSKHRDT